MEDKVWASGLWAKKLKFGNGGSITKISLKVDDFIAWLQSQPKNDAGYLNLDVQGSREPRLDDRGNEKLNVSLDTWKPSPQGQPSPQAATQPQGDVPF